MLVKSVALLMQRWLNLLHAHDNQDLSPHGGKFGLNNIEASIHRTKQRVQLAVGTTP
jgi:hypothetical protein